MPSASIPSSRNSARTAVRSFQSVAITKTTGIWFSLGASAFLRRPIFRDLLQRASCQKGAVKSRVLNPPRRTGIFIPMLIKSQFFPPRSEKRPPSCTSTNPPRSFLPWSSTLISPRASCSWGDRSHPVHFVEACANLSREHHFLTLVIVQQQCPEPDAL
jgi:hypothetical protein